jgi:hypothetical protein
MIGEGGGGELSERAVILEGIKRGHDIEMCTPNTPNKNNILKAEIAIIGNASRFSPQYLAQVSEQQEIVMYLHDFWPLCRHRLFYSALDKCKTTCPHLPFAKKMLLSSSLNIFLSPLHKKMWSRAIPELTNTASYLHVSPVDTKTFVPSDVPKIPNSTLCVNCLLKFKDLENVIQYAETYPERTITCVGAKEANVKLPPNVIPIGAVSQEEMPGMYVQTEEFLHIPNYCEPCGRSTIEAKLCGVPKLTLNKLVGVASYPQFKKSNRDDFAKWIAGSSTRFWKVIEKEVL